jgi:hypothetical protein
MAREVSTPLNEAVYPCGDPTAERKGKGKVGRLVAEFPEGSGGFVETVATPDLGSTDSSPDFRGDEDGGALPPGPVACGSGKTKAKEGGLAKEERSGEGPGLFSDLGAVQGEIH